MNASVKCRFFAASYRRESLRMKLPSIAPTNAETDPKIRCVAMTPRGRSMTKLIIQACPHTKGGDKNKTNVIVAPATIDKHVLTRFFSTLEKKAPPKKLMANTRATK